jgi:CcmD family protein
MKPSPFRTVCLALALLAAPLLALAFSTGDPNFSLVVPDSAGHALAGRAVVLQVELTTGAMDGQAQYVETHALQTGPDGRVSFAIGFGKPTDPKYVFDNFDLSQGDNFARIAIQEAGGWRPLLSTQIPNVPKVQKWLFADAKSNTVIAVMVVAWLGIVVYLLLASRKLKKLEARVAALKQGPAGS